MTQMLLFDAPSQNSVSGSVAVAAEATANLAAELDHDSGLHHMGDLARLVLLRYDLVAKRRAVLAARKSLATQKSQVARKAR